MKPSPRLLAALGGGASALVAGGLLLTHTPAHEGKVNTPYLDPAKVLTVCYGHTGNVQNRRHTDAECLALLEDDLIKHAGPVLKCTPQIKGDPYATYAAVDYAFNIGTTAYCNGTVAGHFRAGRKKEACDTFATYYRGVWAAAPVKGARKCTRHPNRVGKQYYCELGGLITRREQERDICLLGL